MIRVVLTCADLIGNSLPESLLKCSFNNLFESYSLIFLRAIFPHSISSTKQLNNQLFIVTDLNHNKLKHQIPFTINKNRKTPSQIRFREAQNSDQNRSFMAQNIVRNTQKQETKRNKEKKCKELPLEGERG